MKAVFLLQTDPFIPRPALRALREADTLSRAGWDVTFVAWIKAEIPPAGGSPDPYPVRRVPVPVPRLGSGFVKRWGAYDRAMAALSAAAQAERPDLVVAHDFEVLRAGAMVRRSSRARLVYDAHEDYPSIAAANSALEGRIAAREERRLCRRVDHVVTVSEPLADKYRAWGRPATVLYNSRDSAEIHPADRAEARRAFGYGPGDFVAGFTGALAPARGLDLLLDAVARMDASAKALLVGGPPEEVDRLRGKVGALSLVDRVRIDGHRPYNELPPYYAAMDVGVMLLEPLFAPRSRAGPIRPLSLQVAGNLSNKLFDYLAYGLPMVVPDYPAMAQLVRATGAGVVLPELTPAAIVEALTRLRAEPSRRAEMAARGREAFHATYAWERQADRFLAIATGSA